MSEKYLVVKGCAGLGNRISTLCSAIEYAKDTRRTVLVDWGDGCIVQEGHNFFNDYFYLKDVDHLTSYESIQRQKKLSFYPDIKGCDITLGTYHLFDQMEPGSCSWFPFHRLPKNKIRTYRRHWRVKQKTSDKFLHKPLLLFDDKVLPYGGDMSKRVKKDVVFFLDFIPDFSIQTFKQHVFLKDEIHKKINHFLDEALDGGRAIGVHVRCTDKQPDTEIKILVEHIRKINQNNLKVFLATDNVDLQYELKKIFTNLVVYPKSLPKVDAGGIHLWSVRNNDYKKAIELLEASIIDMYLLAACEYLLFQGNSSFSRIAAVMHENERKTVDWNATHVG